MKKLLFLTLAVGTSLMFFSSCGKTESKETELSKQGSLSSRFDTTYINDLVVIKDNEPSTENLYSYNSVGLTDEEALAYGRNYKRCSYHDDYEHSIGATIFNVDIEKYVFSLKTDIFNSSDVIIVVKKHAKLSEQQAIKKLIKSDANRLCNISYGYFRYEASETTYSRRTQEYGENKRYFPIRIINGELSNYYPVNLDVYYDVYYYDGKTDKIEKSFKNCHFEIKSNNLEEKYKYQFNQFCIVNQKFYLDRLKEEVIQRSFIDSNKESVSTPLVNRQGELILFAGMLNDEFDLRK